MNDILHDLLQIRSDVMYAGGLVLALLVSMHVLLRKRDVASAVGWIGLAWFAPLMGAAAYALFGINRVKDRARGLRAQEVPPDDSLGAGAVSCGPDPGGDDPIARLARGITSITHRPILPGNALLTYHDGDQAYPAMLAAIDAARHSVGLSTFIFHDDHWGGRFIDALSAAHDRDVAVRVLIDGIGGGWLTSPAYFHLRRRGVPAARFLHSPLPWRMPFLNLRSHKKILLVDGIIGFTGGMNIADENVMATHPAAPVQDTHFRVEGPVLRQLAEAFAQDWAFATNENLAGPAWFPPPAPPRDSAAGGVPARIINSGPDENIEKIEFAAMQAITCARTSIVIMTPYFLPDERLITTLSLASMRGVSVTIVIPEISDHTLIAWANRADVGPLLHAGVRIWRCPPPFRHSKVMLVDGEWVLIGSCNWDIRSFRLNFEICMEIYDRNLAATLAGLVDRCRGPELTQSELDARPLPIRLRDAAARLLLPYL